MTIFVTGGTGYIGSYVVTRLLEEHDRRVMLLVRAKSRAQAVEKLWNALQLHMSPERFAAALPRIDFVQGDLTAPDLGITGAERTRVADTCTSVLHIAASLNRKSEKECLNANLRGTLSVIQLARAIAEGRGGLERFSHVSTVVVCGKRQSETVLEDTAIEWDRSDYDPYARTKKFCEHMVRQLLPDVKKTFFRPSIVMGDSRHPRTTQFDMVRTFCVLADMPVLPFRGDVRLDIVNADYVGRAIADIHVKERPAHEIYHLTGGTKSPTARTVAESLLSRFPDRRPPRFAPFAERPFGNVMDRLASLPSGRAAGGQPKVVRQAALIGSLFKVFLPYIVWDTVFDNSRVCAELGEEPVDFTRYCGDLYAWGKSVNFKFPYAPLPASAAPSSSSSSEGSSAWA